MYRISRLYLGATGMQSLSAQQAEIQRARLQHIDLPAGVPLEAIMGTAEIPAGVAAGRHTHNGVELGYVLSGEALMEIAGEPSRLVQAGDSFVIPAGVAHDAKTKTGTPAKVISVYVIEKGKPLATPAP